MRVLPKALEDLIDAFGALPGVGPRTAERYAYFLLKNDPTVGAKLAEEAKHIHERIGYCKVTYALVEHDEELSPLYDSPDRDKTTVAVVADPFDIVAIEKTGQYKGTYHVLGGLISPIDGITPDQLHIAQLVKRITSDNVQEIILATNASVEGESTALYIQKELSPFSVQLTRLARGLPVGIDLEYADQITLGRALEGRTVL
jgi:recombination protein RecR